MPVQFAQQWPLPPLQYEHNEPFPPRDGVHRVILPILSLQDNSENNWSHFVWLVLLPDQHQDQHNPKHWLQFRLCSYQYTCSRLGPISLHPWLFCSSRAIPRTKNGLAVLTRAVSFREYVFLLLAEV